MSAAGPTYSTGYTTAAAAPLGVTQAGGGVTYGNITTVQGPTVYMPPQVTYATAPAAEPAEPVMVPGGATYTTAMAPAGATTYTYQGGYTASPAPQGGYTMPAGASLFDALDRNNDGVITRAEFAAMQLPQALHAPGRCRAGLGRRAAVHTVRDAPGWRPKSSGTDSLLGWGTAREDLRLLALFRSHRGSSWQQG